ncbi:transposase [Arenibacter nanhaiticus]|nr:transposase [Arenibacter nanhaiticus]
MKTIASKCFPKATPVRDRFHVQKPASEAVCLFQLKSIPF